MRPALALLVTALVCGSAGCASPGMTPINKTVGRSEFTLRVQTIDKNDAHPVCAQIGGALLPIRHVQIHGCFQWDEGRNRCTIWVAEPEAVEDARAMAVIGHEVWHCVRGLYHP